MSTTVKEVGLFIHTAQKNEDVLKGMLKADNADERFNKDELRALQFALNCITSARLDTQETMDKTMVSIDLKRYNSPHVF